MLRILPGRASGARGSVCFAHRRPRAARRGLGLFDAILAAAVLSFMLLWGGHIVGDWARDRVVTGEARTVSDLARAGRLLVEGDVDHAGHDLDANNRLLEIPLTVDLAAGMSVPPPPDLETARLRSTALGTRTPGRRDLSLWLWWQADNALVVIARAHGEDRPLSRLPGAETGVSGVGVLLDRDNDGNIQGNETDLRGPGVNFDMGPVNAVVAGFATVNDLFALDYVDLDLPCRSYLYRVRVERCDVDSNSDGNIDTDDDPVANTMDTDLDMGDNDLTTTGTLTATTATIETLNGATTVTGALTVDGYLSVTGATTIEGDVDVIGTMEADSADVTGRLTVPNLIATGGVTVDGEARLGDANMNTLTVETLSVRQLSSDEGTFDEIFANDVTVTTCKGCD